MEKIKFSDDISVGGQPSEDDLKELIELGFKSVVNLRTEGEKNQPMSPADEEEMANELGLEYRSIPVSMDTTAPADIDRFREELQTLPLPIFVHCAGGSRAGAFVMMDQAKKSGLTGDEALEKAEQMGFQCRSPEMKEFVKAYVDSHTTG